MSDCLTIDPLSSIECIGDSLDKLNETFGKVQEVLCNLNTQVNRRLRVEYNGQPVFGTAPDGTVVTIDDPNTNVGDTFVLNFSGAGIEAFIDPPGAGRGEYFDSMGRYNPRKTIYVPITGVLSLSAAETIIDDNITTPQVEIYSSDGILPGEGNVVLRVRAPRPPKQVRSFFYHGPSAAINSTSGMGDGANSIPSVTLIEDFVNQLGINTPTISRTGDEAWVIYQKTGHKFSYSGATTIPQHTHPYGNDSSGNAIVYNLNEHTHTTTANSAGDHLHAPEGNTGGGSSHEHTGIKSIGGSAILFRAGDHSHPVGNTSTDGAHTHDLGSSTVNTNASFNVKGTTTRQVWPVGGTVGVPQIGITNWFDFRNPLSYNGIGSTVSDLSLNLRNTTLVNNPVFNAASGDITLASASSQYIITSNLNTDGQYTSTDTSVFVWVYPSTAGTIVTELGTNVINSSWHAMNIEIQADGRMFFSVWQGNLSNRVVSTARAFNQWYLVGFTLTGTTYTAYIDGVPIGSTTLTRGAPYNNGFGLFYALGAIESTNMGTSRYLDGKFRAFYAHNRALTPTEVSDLYAATLVSSNTQTGGGLTDGRVVVVDTPPVEPPFTPQTITTTTTVQQSETLPFGTTSWTPPAGVTTVEVLAVGGGGGGTYFNSTNSAGGGGGGISRNVSYSVTPGTPIAVSIGAGGSSGTIDNKNGISGGSTTFGVLQAATGGTGGVYTTTPAGGTGNYASGGIGGRNFTAGTGATAYKGSLYSGGGDPYGGTLGSSRGYGYGGSAGSFAGGGAGANGVIKLWYNMTITTSYVTEPPLATPPPASGNRGALWIAPAIVNHYLHNTVLWRLKYDGTKYAISGANYPKFVSSFTNILPNSEWMNPSTWTTYES